MQMTVTGKIIVATIVVAILAVGGYKFKNSIFPQAKPSVPSINTVDLNKKIDDLNKKVTQATEAPKVIDITDKLLAGTNAVVMAEASAIPKITTISAYSKHVKNGKLVVEFPINVWPGWAPIIVANNGLMANDNSLFYKQYGFYLNLSIVDDPVKARDLFASGHTEILWGTLDMIALFAPELSKDSRTAPIICQQIDFSNGGDGIVARNGIKSINDFRMMNGIKKRVCLAQNSPSHYFFMTLLLNASIDPADVDFRWTADAPSAAKLFVQDSKFDAFVGWSPDIYTVSESIPGTRIVVSSASANHVVADVWAVRNDFYRDNPVVVKNLVDGIFQGMEMVRKDPAAAAKALSVAYNLPLESCKAMVGADGGIATGDAHLTNYRENYNFFLNPNNPANFEGIWNRASAIYQSLGSIDTIIPAARVKDNRLISSLADKYKESTDLSQPVFNPNMVIKNLEAGEGQILTKSVSIRFPAGKWNVDTNYDMNIATSLVQIAELAGSFGNAYIVIEGNTDGSQKGIVPADPIRKLSYDRAESVKQAIIERYPTLNPNQFKTVGNGWDKPVAGCTDSTNPEHNKKNRRTEIKIFPLES